MIKKVNYLFAGLFVLLASIVILPLEAEASTYSGMVNLSAQTRVTAHGGSAGDYRGNIPTINNLGHYAFTVEGKYAQSGPIYYSNGTDAPSGIGGPTAQSINNWYFLRMNDNDLIGYTTPGQNNNIIATPSGLVHTFDQSWYTPAINNSGRVAYEYSSGSFNPALRYSDPDDYSSFTSTGYDGVKFIDMNNSGQMVWGRQTVNGVVRDGTVLDGSALNQPKIDDAGEVLYLSGNDLRLFNAAGTGYSTLATGVYNGTTYQNSGWYVFLDISDNGDHVVWTQKVGNNRDVFTLIDGTPTNLTAGLFEGSHYCKFPDVNNSGQIIFADFNSQDVYLLNPVPIPPALLLLGSGLFGLVAVRRKKKS